MFKITTFAALLALVSCRPEPPIGNYLPPTSGAPGFGSNVETSGQSQSLSTTIGSLPSIQPQLSIKGPSSTYGSPYVNENSISTQNQVTSQPSNSYGPPVNNQFSSPASEKSSSFSLDLSPPSAQTPLNSYVPSVPNQSTFQSVTTTQTVSSSQNPLQSPERIAPPVTSYGVPFSTQSSYIENSQTILSASPSISPSSPSSLYGAPQNSRITSSSQLQARNEGVNNQESGSYSQMDKLGVNNTPASYPVAGQGQVQDETGYRY